MLCALQKAKKDAAATLISNPTQKLHLCSPHSGCSTVDEHVQVLLLPSNQAPQLDPANLKLHIAGEAGAAKGVAGAAAAKLQVPVQVQRVLGRAAQRQAVRAPELEKVVARQRHAPLMPGPHHRLGLQRECTCHASVSICEPHLMACSESPALHLPWRGIQACGTLLMLHLQHRIEKEVNY